MESILITICILAAQLPAAYLAQRLGTHYTKPQNILINVKPFTCNACLTFWFTALLAGAVTLAAPRVEYFTYALLIAFGNYYYSQTPKIEK